MNENNPPSVPRNLLVPIVKTKRSAKHKDKKKEQKNNPKLDESNV
jgi:hypothetical protein